MRNHVRRLALAGAMATAPLRTEPEFFIVGGKRCGTTSLQSWLDTHPAVIRSHSGKGTHYFDVNYDKGRTWFRAHFPTRAHAALVRRRTGQPALSGEASPYYAFHPMSLDRLHEAIPHARVIFVLREPVERAYSHYLYEVRRGFEDLTFEEALDAEESRIAGEEDRLRADPSYRSVAHVHWTYQARGRYVEQVRRAVSLFGPDQVHLLEFEAMKSDPEVRQRLVAFLRLDPHPFPTLPHHERGGTTDVPAEAAARLREYFAEPNAALEKEFGIGFG
jgi:hypothetical protein